LHLVREATPQDTAAVAALLRAYMLETYDEEWRGSLEDLLRDGFGTCFRTLLAVHAQQPVGFLAWEKAYDLHHCLSGGQVLDLFVMKQHRARGIAVLLIARAAALIHGEGGAFLKGGAVDHGTASRLYGRFAPAFGNDYILGGRAFRHLAAQAHLPVRSLARAMPSREWNFEP
jgi:GNAT superfamily N-acetyltransferase